MQNQAALEDWQLDFEWLRVRHLVKEKFDKDSLPDLNAILFVIGIQELGQTRQSFSKEEKQDLMHIAVCRLLEQDGYYTFEGLDADGWPHYSVSRSMVKLSLKEQEMLLKQKIIQYFQEIFGENGFPEINQ